ncbi:MAG TPA: hypothetical protein VHW23_30535 [Kofleriaceae bacterium]|nr:hypothetical protein [Kofleriaceae bacterium]
MVVDSDTEAAEALALKLTTQFPGIRVVTAICQCAGQSPAEISSDIDLIIVRLSALGSSELAYALGLLQVTAASQIVFWAEDAQCPQVSAARAVGIRTIVPADPFWPWLCEAMPSLVLKARGQRILDKAERAMPPVPPWMEHTPNGSSRLPLMQAESLFRETYLRWLLAETSNCRRAAELAGVPYRTFYDMVKKLDLR